MTLEEAYLEHILLHLRSGDSDDRQLRTYMDSWYAHSVGAQLLVTKTARPRWMNRGDLAERPDLAFACHAISEDALAAINVGQVTDLAKDHTPPLRLLITHLRSEVFGHRDELRSYLKRHYRVAIVMQHEHRALTKADRLRKRTNTEFNHNQSPFARYDCPATGIKYRVLSVEG